WPAGGGWRWQNRVIGGRREWWVACRAAGRPRLGYGVCARASAMLGAWRGSVASSLTVASRSADFTGATVAKACSAGADERRASRSVARRLSHTARKRRGDESVLMVIPREDPAAGRAAAVPDQGEGEGRGSDSAETVARPCGGRDVPARHRRARTLRWTVAEQETQATALPRRQREATRRRQICAIVGQLGNDGDGRAMLERFFHRPQHIERTRHAQHD